MIDLQPSGLSATELTLRDDVRSFLAAEEAAGAFTPGLGIGAEAAGEFSRRLAERGWLGMVVPREYGGLGRTAVERFVVAEELLAVGAPISAHWVGDRQTAQMFLAFGSEDQKQLFLPQIVRAETFFCLGLSEPEAGSDLASVRTRAERVDGGWVVNGLKTWTSGAHYAHYAMVLCRTSPVEGSRHVGLTQLIVDMRAEGVGVSPIRLLNGFHHFNELRLENVFVPDEFVLGDVGAGWHQVTSELAYERSGPDRFLSTFPLVKHLLAAHSAAVRCAEHERLIGRLFARYWVLHHMSLAMARSLDTGKVPTLEAAFVKDVGTLFEQEVVQVVRSIVASAEPPIDEAGETLANQWFAHLLGEAILTSPTFTLRGGTNEILRTLAAKQLFQRWRAHG